MFKKICFVLLSLCLLMPMVLAEVKTLGKPSVLRISDGPDAKNLSKNKGVIVWQTNVVSSSIVEWGLTSKYDRIARGNSGASHKVYLGGMKGGEVYHYRSSSKTPEGLQVVSGDDIFETPTPDLIIKQVLIPKQVTVGNTYTAQVTVMISSQPLDGPYTVQIFRAGSFDAGAEGLDKRLTLLGETQMPPQPANVYRTASISFQMAPLPGLEEGFQTGDNFVVKVVASENEKILGNNQVVIPFIANP